MGDKGICVLRIMAVAEDSGAHKEIVTTLRVSQCESDLEAPFVEVGEKGKTGIDAGWITVWEIGW
jgi:hypothetical protein